MRKHPEYRIDKGGPAGTTEDITEEPSQKRRRTSSVHSRGKASNVYLQTEGSLLGVPAFWEAADNYLEELTSEFGDVVEGEKWRA